MRRKDKIVIPITPEIVRVAELLLTYDINKSKCLMGDNLDVYAEYINKHCAKLGRLFMQKLLDEKIIRYEDVIGEIKNGTSNGE